jgi:hypothetical protein
MGEGVKVVTCQGKKQRTPAIGQEKVNRNDDRQKREKTKGSEGHWLIPDRIIIPSTNARMSPTVDQRNRLKPGESEAIASHSVQIMAAVPTI